MTGHRELRRRAAAGIAEVAGSGLRLPLVGVRPMAQVQPVEPEAIVVRGARHHEPPQRLYFTAAMGDVDLTVGQALAHLFTPGWQLMSRRSALHGLSKAEFEYLGFLDRGTSEQSAAAAACTLLGIPPVLEGSGARVLDCDPEGPAAALAPGDVIIAVNGQAVHVAVQAVDLLRQCRGEVGARLEVLREFPSGGARAESLVRTVRIRPSRRDTELSYGLRLATHRPQLDLPVDIEFRLDADAAGPSGGLMLALAVLDVLTPGSITGGLRVAGTGTITMDGRVGDVGWIALKARAASRSAVDIMFVPAGGERQAVISGSSTRVVPVTHLAQAVTFLIGHGGDKPVLRPGAYPSRALSPNNARA